MIFFIIVFFKSAAFETKAAYEKQAWLDYVTQFDQSTFADQDIARRLDLMDNIDVSALEEDRLVAVSIVELRRQFTNPLLTPYLSCAQYNEIVNGMMGVYGSGKVCPYENQECDPETEGMNLEPEIEEQMAENRDYDQLAYYWQKWRDATGSVYRLLSRLELNTLITLRPITSFSSGQITRATSTSKTRRP